VRSLAVFSTEPLTASFSNTAGHLECTGWHAERCGAYCSDTWTEAAYYTTDNAVLLATNIYLLLLLQLDIKFKLRTQSSS